MNKKHYYLDLLGLFSIGIISLGYVVFIKGLAEQHIQLPFLNFPIFVGEILLFICLLFFLAKYANYSEDFTKQKLLFIGLIVGYFAFVSIKAQYGYLKWGPLALRHAALLYYPAFAVFGYAFFRKEFFNGRKSLIFLLIIAVTLISKHSDYWLLTLVLLGAILIKAYPHRKIRLFMVLVLLLAVPYKEFFQTARMMIAGNFLSGLYLSGVLPVVLEIRKKLKFALMALIGGIVIIGLLKFGDQRAVQSIIAFKKMAAVMRSCDEYIEANIDHFQMEKRKEVKLYNPDKLARNTSTSSGKVQAEAKAELKQIVVQHVKEKIEDFSFKPIDGRIHKNTVQEVKQEMESILDKQLLKEKPKSLEVREVGVSKREDEAEKNQPSGQAQAELKQIVVQHVKEKIEDFSFKPIDGRIHKNTVQEVKQEMEPILDKQLLKEKYDAEVKIEMREILFKQVEQEIRRAPVAKIISEKKRLDIFAIDAVKSEIQKDLSEEFKRNRPVVSAKKNDTGWVENNNAVFRLLIWRDMLADLAKEKPVVGFNFGRPFRSKSLEILNWGTNDWARDGWIGAHNSYLEIIYRTGVIGILLILSLWIILFKMIKKFILTKSFTGILLCGIIINWFTAANFLLIFELPYTAIPIWTIYGMTFAYCYKKTPREL